MGNDEGNKLHQNYLVIDKNPIKICWFCKKKFNGNFEIKDFQIICPFCKRPQSSVFEEDSKDEIMQRTKEEISELKAELVADESQPLSVEDDLDEI
jgi:uncharacterized Zn finger protein (UPF0148 family)